MNITPPNLTKLNFSEIKSSLTEFLKNQSVFNGYNFEGTVIQTVIDLLAYNTYYYAFYSNMIANEAFLDTARKSTSIISLLKPLGYTVPGKKSATAYIKIFTDDSELQSSEVERYTLFSASASDGSFYNFYTLNPVVLVEGVGGEETGILVAEAKKIVKEKNITSEIDLIKQKYLIAEPDIDISTIRIEVKSSDSGEWTEWTNVNFFPNNNNELFYIDRLGDTFVIDFGKANNLGRSILSTDEVRISYLVTSGTAGNELFQFVNGIYTILDATTSGGGSDGPDLNLIKFLAPKIFSAQERAVTSSDYTALLLKNGYISNPSQVAVYGGDEINPSKYGRVFVSFPSGVGNPNEIVEFLREKNMITVIPEYIIPKTVDVVLNATATVSSSLSQSAKQFWKNKILNSFKTTFSTHTSGYAFGLQFVFGDWSQEIVEKYGGPNGPVMSVTFNKMHFLFGVEDAPETTISFGTNLTLDGGDISNDFDLIGGGTGRFVLNVNNITVNGIPSGSWNSNQNTIVLKKVFTQHLQPRISLKSNNRNISTMNTIMTKFSLNLTIESI
jgi:hypothetical protein